MKDHSYIRRRSLRPWKFLNCPHANEVQYFLSNAVLKQSEDEGFSLSILPSQRSKIRAHYIEKEDLVMVAPRTLIRSSFRGPRHRVESEDKDGPQVRIRMDHKYHKGNVGCLEPRFVKGWIAQGRFTDGFQYGLGWFKRFRVCKRNP